MKTFVLSFCIASQFITNTVYSRSVPDSAYVIEKNKLILSIGADYFHSDGFLIIDATVGTYPNGLGGSFKIPFGLEFGVTDDLEIRLHWGITVPFGDSLVFNDFSIGMKALLANRLFSNSDFFSIAFSVQIPSPNGKFHTDITEIYNQSSTSIQRRYFPLVTSLYTYSLSLIYTILLDTLSFTGSVTYQNLFSPIEQILDFNLTNDSFSFSLSADYFIPTGLHLTKEEEVKVKLVGALSFYYGGYPYTEQPDLTYTQNSTISADKTRIDMQLALWIKWIEAIRSTLGVTIPLPLQDDLIFQRTDSLWERWKALDNGLALWLKSEFKF